MGRKLPFLPTLIGVALVSMSQVVLAQPLPPQDPILRIEPGMHTTMIRRIGVDAACTRIVTGSNDKTARIWDISDPTQPVPKHLRTLRPPIGYGNEGEISAVAMSPDGESVAMGLWARNGGDNRVYVFGATSGRFIWRSDIINDSVNHLAFSKDGRRMAASMHGGRGVQVWRTSDWRRIFEDTNYNQGPSYSVAFDGRGRLWTIAYDNSLRRYQPTADGRSYTAPRIVRTLGGKRPFSLAVHPNDDRIAIGYDDTVNVDVYDANAMRRLFAADVAGVGRGKFNAVSWSSDGSRLFAGGTVNFDGTNAFRVWDRAGRGRGHSRPGSRDTVLHMRPCGNSVAISAADPAFGLIDMSATPRVWHTSVKPDMRGKRSGNFEVSADGRRVRFGLKEWSNKPVLFDMRNETVTRSRERPGDVFLARTETLAIKNWINSTSPTLAGKPIELKPYELARAYAIAPDDRRFVLGADWSLRAYDSSGKSLWTKPVPGAAWGVNIPQDGRTAVIAYDDGTIRWHRLSDGKELLALFVHTEDMRWVLWTPTGYYTTSPGGEDLIGWHVNQGWEREASFFPVKLFRKQFYRPDIIRLVLNTLDEERAIEQANSTAQRPRGTEAVKQILPPVVQILEPKTGSRIAKSTIQLTYLATSATGEAIQDVEVRVDGQRVDYTKTRGAMRVRPKRNKNAVTIEVPVPPRDVTVSLIAWTGNRSIRRVSEAATVDVKWTGIKPDTANLPRLVGLFVGVSDYEDNSLDLNYADDDAKALSAAFQNQKGLAYREVLTRVLTDSDATLRGIKQGLKWLRDTAQPDDIVVISLAGHGFTDSTNDFHFLPHEATADEPTLDGISKDVLLSRISRTKGRRVIFIDACHSGDGLSTPGQGLGPADMTGLVNEFSDPQVGVIMYAASTGRQVSVESHRWRQGAFTKALLEGLAGDADTHGGLPAGIHTGEIDLWLTQRVAELTNNKQTPTMVKSNVPHFTLAMLH